MTTISMQRLRSAIAAAIPAAYTKKDRLDLLGICIEADAQKRVVRVIATNRAVMAQTAIECADVSEPFRCRLSKDDAKRMVGVIGKRDGDASLFRAPSLLRVTLERVGTLDFDIDEEPPFAETDALWPTSPPVAVPQWRIKRRAAATVLSVFAKATGQRDPALNFYGFDGCNAYLAECADAPTTSVLVAQFDDGADEQKQGSMFAEPK